MTFDDTGIFSYGVLTFAGIMFVIILIEWLQNK
jgi:hypothetical protein